MAESTVLRKKLMVISQYFYPEQFRINDMCTEWVSRGYEVTVITGIPNYPDGKYYAGYGWLTKRKEVRDGVQIIRLPIISRGKSKIRLALNYFSFVAAGFLWARFTRITSDLVFIYEVSPMTQSLVGVWYGKRRSIPIIHHVTDLWPENVAAVSGIDSKFVYRWINKMVDYIYKNNSTILTSARSFLPVLSARGVPQEKLAFWPHYAEEYYIPQPANSDKEASDLIPKKTGVFNLGFTGNIGVAQGLNILVDTALLLRDKHPKVIFYIIGEGRGKQGLVNAIVEAGVESSFRFIDRKPAFRIPFFLAQCDAGLLILSDNPIFLMSLPSKLQSYMACGMPILASGAGEVADIIEESQAGFCATPGDATSLANSIGDMIALTKDELEEMSMRSRRFFLENYEKHALMDIMDEVFKNASIA